VKLTELSYLCMFPTGYQLIIPVGIRRAHLQSTPGVLSNMPSCSCLSGKPLRAVLCALILSTGFSQQSCPPATIQCFKLKPADTQIGERFSLDQCRSGSYCSPSICGISPIAVCNQRYAECEGNCGAATNPQTRRSLRTENKVYQ
jgi:hypothetical protein